MGIARRELTSKTVQINDDAVSQIMRIPYGCHLFRAHECTVLTGRLILRRELSHCEHGQQTGLPTSSITYHVSS